MVIDTAFDFRTDASGRDPDVYSPTLRQYHKLLWSKVLPSGRHFELHDTVRGAYPVSYTHLTLPTKRIV